VAGYNIFSHLTALPDAQEYLAGLTAGAALVFFAAKASKPLREKKGNVNDQLVPEKKFGLTGFFDAAVEAFVKYHDSVVGKENRRYLSLSGTVFFFIFFMNLLGLVPGWPASTTTVWINVAIALVVFFAFNTYGIREQGIKGYFGHMMGPVWLLAPVILVLELFSLSLRILTLNLRLYWNISADHTVLQIFTDLVPVLVPVVFYAFGTFVAFVQAFVFTTLTMIYILLATQHQEHEHH